MARIIAGSARGRILTVPPRGTRPTTDRIKEAIFSSLASYDAIKNSRVLDLYAGCGALGIEALSRGAQSGVFVDNNHKATDTIRQNCALVDNCCDIRCVDTITYLSSPQEHCFNLVFCDPPYSVSSDMITIILILLADHCLATGAKILIERAKKSDSFTVPKEYSIHREKIYGNTRITFLDFQ